MGTNYIYNERTCATRGQLDAPVQGVNTRVSSKLPQGIGTISSTSTFLLPPSPSGTRGATAPTSRQQRGCQANRPRIPPANRSLSCTYFPSPFPHRTPPSPLINKSSSSSDGSLLWLELRSGERGPENTTRYLPALSPTIKPTHTEQNSAELLFDQSHA